MYLILLTNPLWIMYPHPSDPHLYAPTVNKGMLAALLPGLPQDLGAPLCHSSCSLQGGHMSYPVILREEAMATIYSLTKYYQAGH